MKKLLSLFGVIGFIIPSGITLVSCSDNNTGESNDINLYAGDIMEVNIKIDEQDSVLYKILNFDRIKDFLPFRFTSESENVNISFNEKAETIQLSVVDDTVKLEPTKIFIAEMWIFAYMK
ncbi:lipoprotein [Spiroplasma endosymbiont of Labia minor]|uniref:lipoprotein n=1 Tax=Spiroplasma endosymbiont of Labia minor TaxID=3066305 RepID=UPI0030CB2501